MTGNIKIRHIDSLDDLESLQVSWEKLFKQRKRKTVFLTWEWLFAWWSTHHEGKELWLITAWQMDELVGIAPLMLSQERKYSFRFRLLQSLGAPNTDESDFITKDDDTRVLSALCQYILQNRKKWDAIRLHEHCSSLASTKFIRDAFSKENLIIRSQDMPHYYLTISGSWDAYFKSLSKNLRQNMVRRLRRTQESFSLTFEHYKGQEVTWKQMETIFEINKNGSFPEKYESEKERTLHRKLLDIMKPKGWIEITVISLNGDPVAFEYGFNLDGSFEDWRTGYNTNYGKLGIGKILLYFLLKEFFEQGYASFDFLRGEYDHKRDWQPSKNDFSTITAIHPANIPARIALIVIPALWEWIKVHFLSRNKRTSAGETKTTN